jgi:hypothetical protein
MATSLTLAIVSAHGESRASKVTEGELAVELFGLIAEQSGCSKYAVAWLESTTQQVRYRCHDTPIDFQRFTATLGNKPKFLIDVIAATAEYRQRFGNAGLPRPTSLLAHDLVSFRRRGNQNGARSPMLIHTRVIPGETDE